MATSRGLGLQLLELLEPSHLGKLELLEPGRLGELELQGQYPDFFAS